MLISLALCMCSGFVSSNKYLSPRNLERAVRKSTRFIILHTTEAEANSSLNKLSRRGEAHYCVDRNGIVYRIVKRDKVAYHCGRSMWNGLTNIDNYSVGIEIIGYHDKPLTEKQYKAVAELVRQLQSLYGVSDFNVMSHSQVAYGSPNRWHRRSHRGRKRCGMSFATPQVRAKFGLDLRYKSDPDIKANRLVVADDYLAKVLYSPIGYSLLPFRLPSPAVKPTSTSGKPLPSSTSSQHNVVGPRRSAWDIVRDAYDEKTTIYTWPDGSRKTGDQITNWANLPSGTRVTVTEQKASTSKILTISKNATARKLVGDKAKSPSTYYIVPTGGYRRGSSQTEASLKALPVGTKILIGYRVGGPVQVKYLPATICPFHWNAPETYYLINGVLQSRSQVDMNKVPVGTMIFYKE